MSTKCEAMGTSWSTEKCRLCAVLERYRERLTDRHVEVIVGNVAVIPCTAVSHSSPAAHTQFEFNSVRLRMTSTSRDLTHFRSSPLFAVSGRNIFIHALTGAHHCQKTGKSGPTHKPRYRASAEITFIIAIQPFYGCQ